MRACPLVALVSYLVAYSTAALADESNPEPCTMDVVATLSGQGQWLIGPGGSPAWQPSPIVVGDDFVPYQTGGAWADRDGARVFATPWSWGELVFSEGSWTFDPDEGWLWLPDPRCVRTGSAVAANGQPVVLPVLLLPANTRPVNRPFGGPMVYPSGRGQPLTAAVGNRPVAPSQARPVGAMPAKGPSTSRASANNRRSQ